MDSTTHVDQALLARIEQLESENRRLRTLEEDYAEKARLFTAVEQSHDNITLAAPDGTIVYVNPAVEQSTGYSRAELVGANPSILKSGQQKPEFYRELWKTIRSGQVWTGRLFNRRKDGTHFQEEGSISPVFDDHGVITNYVAVKRDITRLVELEQRLSTANKMESLGVLAGGIAHEINSPVQFIGDNLSFLTETFQELTQLLRALLDPDNPLTLEEMRRQAEDMEVLEMLEDAPEALADSIQGVQRIADIVASMRMYAHPGQQMENMNLNAVAKTAATMSKNEWKYTSDLSLELDPELASVFGNQGQLMQVLLNMITNAAQAFQGQQGKGKIQIRTANTLDGVVLEIEDDGMGIPPEVLPKVFDQFFTTKGVGKGTGQGLAICSTIVEAHNGKIEVSSEPGNGTIFRILLPCSG